MFIETKKNVCNTLEELLKSRRHTPMATLNIAKDMARRIIKLEKIIEKKCLKN